MYYTYMLRCKDNSIYTGITTNVERRMKEHFCREEKCAKYTFTHIALNLEAVWESENRMLASKLEYNVKKLTKSQKEKLIRNADLLEKFLGNKLDSSLYKRI